jgi:poly(rC)-binding protein 2/3/4
VIGRAGSTIKTIRQESGARIDVDDAKNDKEESIINITSTEVRPNLLSPHLGCALLSVSRLLLYLFRFYLPFQATDDVKSAAVEAVLLLQAKINDFEEDRMSLRLLVPNKVIGCLIGRGGSIIIDMRKKTKADIRISKGEKPRRASSSDELVEV